MKIFNLTVLTFYSFVFSFGQTDSVNFYLLNEIEVTSKKYQAKLKDVSLPVEILNQDEIFTINAATSCDILKNKPGLTVLRDGIWGTFLSVRGLSKNNVVSLIDENRIETANDIAAGLSLIDVNDIKRIEIIKSASSALYGTGALGGVINIITDRGFYPERLESKTTITSSYSSVNNNGAGTLSSNFGNKTWFINLRGTLRSADDIKTPDGILKNSQFRNRNYSFSSGYQITEKHELKISYQNYLAEDVGIPGNSLFTENAEVKYLKARRKLSSVEYVISNPFYTLTQLKAKVYYQEIDRLVENKPGQVVYSNNNTTRTSVLKILPDGNHKTIGGNIQSNWIFGKHLIVGGIEIWQRELVTDRERKLLIETLDTNTQSVINTLNKIIGEKPVPDSRFLSIGFFLQDEFSLNDKFIITVGARADHVDIYNEEVYNPSYEINNGIINSNPPGKKLIWNNQEARNYSWSSNLSLHYSINKDVSLTFAAARSFRSPSLEERYQYIDLGNFVKLGNPDLSPEKGYYLDAGLRIWNTNLILTGNVFMNFLDNLVSEKPGIFEGRPAFVNTNIGKARFYGFDLGAQYIYKKYSLAGSLSFVNGKDFENNTYLPQIPPLNGRIILSYTPVSYLKGEFTAAFFMEQNNIAPGELKTPGYIIYDINLFSFPIKLSFTELRIAGGIENIANKSYRSHASSFRGLIKSEPGRNYFVKMKMEL